MPKQKTKTAKTQAEPKGKVLPMPKADAAGDAKKGRKRGLKKAAKAEAKPQPKAATETTTDDAEELVVFAFRLTRSERDAIHEAAGPARASKFVRGLALAAARGDLDGIGKIIAEAGARD